MIENQIKRAVVIQAKGKMGKVELGSTVVLRTNNKATDDLRPASPKLQRGEQKTLTFQILGAFETNPSKGIISDQSPLGKALIGRKVGDEVIVKTEAGEKKYKILEAR